MYAARDAGGQSPATLWDSARQLILKDEGLLQLIDAGAHPSEDFIKYFFGCPDDTMPTVIEAVHAAMLELLRGSAGWNPKPFDFTGDVQKILAEERVAYDFSDGHMIPFESKELHQAVVEPALKLLHNPQFAKPETAYRQALEELSKGTAGNAITDAGTALQETLAALGCEGNRLGPLIKSAKAKGLLAAHDARMTQAIEEVMEWVSADRSEMGDSHKVDNAGKDDAWFIIHVVGALIVRLVGASGR